MNLQGETASTWRVLSDIQGVSLRLKPYDCIKLFDVTLKLKPAAVLLPLELVSNFSNGLVLGMVFFGDFRPKGSIWAILYTGRRVKLYNVANWHSNLETVHILAILRGLLGFPP